MAIQTRNAAAADWWAKRFNLPAKARQFHERLVNILDSRRWEWSLNSQDTGGLLARAVRAVSSAGRPPEISTLFPAHAAMEIREGIVWVREGRGVPWTVLRG